MNSLIIAEKLHSVLCDRSHTGDCDFYDEQAWNEPSHMQWLTVAEQMRKASGLSEESILENMDTIISSISKIVIAIGSNPVLKKYAERAFRSL